MFSDDHFNYICERRLRFSRSFSLVPYDSLPERAREEVATLGEDAPFFGVLIARDGELPPRAVARDVALLLYALQEPRALPTLVRDLVGDAAHVLFRLILDGIVEVEHAGRFVSGSALHEVIASALPESGSEYAASATARASREAIVAGLLYEGLTIGTLTARLYAYGRCPMGPRSPLHGAETIAFLTGGGEGRVGLDRDWHRQEDAGVPWIHFATNRGVPLLTHKLYVAARIAAMPKVFTIAVEALRRARCDRFKVGRGVEGMSRPDKMVAYFESLEHLRECSERLARALEAAALPPEAAQCVPFTAPIDRAGFLSWGMDPPGLADRTQGTTSFRLWLAGRVASAILHVDRATQDLDALVSAVLRRVELDGIDAHTWTPSASLWRPHAAHAEEVA